MPPFSGHRKSVWPKTHNAQQSAAEPAHCSHGRTFALALVSALFCTWIFGAMALSYAKEAPALLHSTPVPSSLLKQGEVRLIKDGDLLIVQSLLYSKYMGRIQKKIIQNESENWTRDSAGFQDMNNFCSLLKDAVVHAENAFAQKPKHSRLKRPSLLIEFVRGPDHSSIRFCEVELDIDSLQSSTWRVIDKHVFQEMTPAWKEYVPRNQELILQDAFKADPGIVNAWIRSGLSTYDSPQLRNDKPQSDHE